MEKQHLLFEWDPAVYVWNGQAAYATPLPPMILFTMNPSNTHFNSHGTAQKNKKGCRVRGRGTGMLETEREINSFPRVPTYTEQNRTVQLQQRNLIETDNGHGRRGRAYTRPRKR